MNNYSEIIHDLVMAINRTIWGLPLITALLGISIYFSFKLKFLQISRLKLAIKYVIDGKKYQDGKGDISNFASFCAALSATLGTGNIVGVALAVTTGGPGAIFWMWIAAFFGMAAKYAEGLLAIKYRQMGSDGKIAGGPMYYIEMGLGNKWLAKLFAFFGMGTALIGIGTWTQSNSIAAAAANSLGIPLVLTAILLGIIVAVVTIGGIQRIAYVSEKIVPFMSIFYIGAAIVLLIMKANLIPHAIYLIVRGAFSPEAILGGSMGITFMTTMKLGISRGIFSHESGLGSAAIAAAAAKTDSPVKQGLVSMIGAFFSIIVCTMTALVLIITSKETAIFTPQYTIDGALITSHAFGLGLKNATLGKYVVDLGILFFAFTTIIGWNYYGEKCVQYLWGTGAIAAYKILFLFFVIIGPFFKIDIIFTIADIATGLMAIANLTGLIGLRKVIVEETALFFNGKQGE
ncbi:MAG: sodium:alanine symporter family protein [Puniceicoccales bacterium]|jgi:AGCS family alanine or glycine:cation symporter|nr:sodium:alanine symporter family protein [Puniceicoccales bacterium]